MLFNEIFMQFYLDLAWPKQHNTPNFIGKFQRHQSNEMMSFKSAMEISMETSSKKKSCTHCSAHQISLKICIEECTTKHTTGNFQSDP